MVASEDKSNRTFDVDDFGLTPSEWEKMSDEDKGKVIQDAVDNLPEHPYWVVDSFNDSYKLHPK